MDKKIFLSAPHMGGKELEYIKEVFESNYIAPVGAFLDRFEESVSNYTTLPYTLATTNATAALHLALRVVGVERGDDVLVSTFTFIGSVNPILYVGANPIFIDSDKESWHLSPKLLNKYLLECEKKPKALLIAHIYGMSADIEKIADICNRHGIYLIEDCAESLGATFKKQHSGTYGDVSVFSFNGNKILTTSGGGIFATKNKEFRQKALFLSMQAKENELYYEHKELGYNYRMSNVLAAIGVAQMEVLEQRVEKKREIYRWYKDALSDVKEISFMPELASSHGTRWLTTILFEKENIYQDVMKALAKEGVESRPLWKPMHLQPLFADATSYIDGTSEFLFNHGLSLASSTTMSRDDVEYISNIIKDTL